VNLLLVLYQFKNYKLVSYKLVSLQGQADDLFFGVERVVPGNMSVIGAGHVRKIYERAMKILEGYDGKETGRSEKKAG
jgi:dsRNA-specific ribonuclease